MVGVGGGVPRGSRAEPLVRGSGVVFFLFMGTHTWELESYYKAAYSYGVNRP